MDILYIVGRGFSHCSNNELRYSLRSLEKFGKNIDKIYVVGYCPPFLSSNVIKIPFRQRYTEPQNEYEKGINLLESLLYAVDNSDIGDEFLVSMDDHIYIRETDFSNYPFYVKPGCEGTYEIPTKHYKDCYNNFLFECRKLLEQNKLSTYYFVPHRNMHISRKSISECREIFKRVVNEKLACEPFLFLLNYRFSTEGFPITKIVDYKLKGGTEWWKASPLKTEVISTYDFKENSGLDVLLKGIFNKKSKYEL